MSKGWADESMRHSLASYGIKTGTKLSKIVKKNPNYYFDKDWGTFRQAIAESQLKKKQKPVLTQLDKVEGSIKYFDSIANKDINEAKRKISAEKELDFLNMDGRTMAYSILSDAQEELSRGNKDNALLFVKQAKWLYQNKFKRDGHEITFPDGDVAIF